MCARRCAACRSEPLSQPVDDADHVFVNGATRISASFDVSYGLDPWSFTLPVARLGGVTRAVVVPNHPGGGGGHYHEDDTAGVGHGGLQSPGLFAGQAAVIHLAQGTDILVRPRVAMVGAPGRSPS